MSDTGAAARFEDVAPLRDLADGTLLGVKLGDGTRVCLFNHRGTVGAVGGMCTHAEFPMDDGTLRADGTIECAWHGARFDCRTGAVCRPPAVDPLPVFEVRVENDRVLVGPMITSGMAERDA